MKKLLTPCLAAYLACCVLPPLAPVAQTRRRLPARSASTPAARTSQTSPVPARVSTTVATTAAEPDGNLDELVARGSYALLSETRSIVEWFDSPLVTESLAPLRAAGIVPPETIVMMDFVKTHRALLAQSRVVTFVVPLKPTLPQFIFALETPGAEDARTLEPQIKRLLKKLAPSIAAATGQSKPRTTNARRGKGNNARKTEPDSSSGLSIMRVGRTLFISDAPVKLNALRPANAPAFTADAQMRDMRSRFMPSTAFLYFDANGFRKFMTEQSAKTAQSAAVVSGASGVIVGGVAVTANENSAGVSGIVSDDISGGDPITPEPQAAVVTPISPPPAANQTGQITATVTNPTAVDVEPEAVQDETGVPEPPPAPSEIDRLSSFAFPALFGSFTRGYESVEAVGAAFNLDSEAASIRVLIANKQGIPVGPIPLLPFIVSGKPLATQAANLMPVDTGIFASVSLDMPRIYDEFIGSAQAVHASELEAAKKANAATAAASSPSAKLATEPGLSPLETSILEIETKHSFKFRDELLAAFGNEIAFGVSEKWLTKEMSPSVPVDDDDDDDDAETKTVTTLTPSSSTGATTSPVSTNDKSKQDSTVAADAAPPSMGMYFLIAVQDKARLQRLLPVALELAGIKVPKDINLIERRDGVESVMFTNNMVSFVGDYLLLTPDAEAASAVIKAFREGGSLAADNRFTAARSWQTTEKLGEFYVANTLVKALINVSQKSVLAAIGNVPNPYAGIDIDPRAVTYTITADPLGAHHELRIPIDAVRLFSQTSSLAAAHQEVITNDSMAQGALRSIYYAQLQHRYKPTLTVGGDEGDIRTESESDVKTEDAPFVSLEELSGKSEDGEDNAERFKAKGYRIEMSANGSKFEATATPEVYGKTGRRSFFINEKGNLRGGDLAGRAATASDKRIN